MKKFVAVVLVLALALSLGACAPATPSPSQTSTSSAPTESTAPQSSAPVEPTIAPEGGTIGVTLYQRDQFISNLEQAIIKASEGTGYTVDTQEANSDTQKQAEQIRTFAATGADSMIVNLVETTTAQTMIAEAGGTPIIFINRRPVDDLLLANKYAYVGSQESDAGKMQAEFLANYFKDKADKKLDVVMFKGELGLENTNERTRAAKEELEKAGFELNMVFEDTAKWDRSIAMDKMQTFIGTGVKFDCVISNNDEMALGAIEAMKAAKIDLSKIPVVGIDATDGACVSVENGEMAATVFQNATEQGRVAMDFAIKAAKGENFETFGWVPFEPVTKENVANYKKK